MPMPALLFVLVPALEEQVVRLLLEIAPKETLEHHMSMNYVIPCDFKGWLET